MPDRPSVHEVVAKLQTYGSADQIAQFFEREGVVGKIDKSHSCAVANYVTQETGQFIHATQSAVWGEDGVVELDPDDDPISQFITKFDIGMYPALVLL